MAPTRFGDREPVDRYDRSLAAAYDEPERAADARELASAAAVRATAIGAGGGLAFAEVSAQIRSTAVDLMRAAELVAGAPDQLPTEELLLMPELALA